MNLKSKSLKISLGVCSAKSQSKREGDLQFHSEAEHFLFNISLKGPFILENKEQVIEKRKKCKKSTHEALVDN